MAYFKQTTGYFFGLTSIYWLARMAVSWERSPVFPFGKLVIGKLPFIHRYSEFLPWNSVSLQILIPALSNVKQLN